MLNLYITSANHKEGKTFLTAGIASTMQSLGYSTAVYKPIQTSGKVLNGFTQSPDLTFIKTMDAFVETSFSYIFKEQNEPLIASENEGNYIDTDVILKEFKRLKSSFDCTILDGDSGLLSPIALSLQTADLLRKLQVPILFVASPSENTINNILLNINLAQEKGLDIRGVVINNIQEDCPKERLTAITRVIEEYSNVNILGLVPFIGDKILPENLITETLNGIDIESIFKVKIEKLNL